MLLRVLLPFLLLCVSQPISCTLLPSKRPRTHINDIDSSKNAHIPTKFEDLPPDILMRIFSSLPPESLITSTPANKYLHSTAKQDTRWIEYNQVWRLMKGKMYPLHDLIKSTKNQPQRFLIGLRIRFRQYLNDLIKSRPHFSEASEAEKAEASYELIVRELKELDEDGFTAIHIAAQIGHEHALSTMLKIGIPFDMRKDGGQTPLMLARQFNQQAVGDLLQSIDATFDSMEHHECNTTQLRELLADHRVNANVRNANLETLLHLAVSNDDDSEECPRILLDSGAIVDAKTLHGQTPLMLANNLNVCRFLLQRGANVNATDLFGRSALFNAVDAGDLEIAMLLLDHNADYLVRDKERCNLYHAAAAFGFEDVVEWVASVLPAQYINELDIEGHTPLYTAVLFNSIQAVDALLRHGADPNIKAPGQLTPLQKAIQENQFAMSVKLSDHIDESRCPLRYAIERGDLEELKFYLEYRNVDIDCVDGYYKRNALSWAAILQQDDLASWLLDRGANPNLADLKEKTALHYAAASGRVALIERLLTGHHAAMIDAKDHSQQTPLFMAVMNGHVDAVKELLSKGANPNIGSKEMYPVHYASAQKDSTILEYLLEAGANPNVLDAHGRSPLQLSVYGSNSQNADVLMRWGALKFGSG